MKKKDVVLITSNWREEIVEIAADCGREVLVAEYLRRWCGNVNKEMSYIRGNYAVIVKNDGEVIEIYLIGKES